ALLGSSDSNSRTNRLEIVQQEQRRLIEAEVLDRLRDFSVLDQECTVARKTSEQNRSRINGAEIPQSRHENSALRRLDHVIDRSRARNHLDRRRATCRSLVLLLSPEARIE